jgi:hypothetical protein
MIERTRHEKVELTRGAGGLVKRQRLSSAVLILAVGAATTLTVMAGEGSLVTNRLTALAEDFLIPVPANVTKRGEFPEDDAAWIESPITGRWQLSRGAAADLRAAIRKEERERSELAFRFLAGITGVLGTLIGLVALLTRHNCSPTRLHV